METLILNTVEHPLNKKTLHSLSFDELFEVLKIKKDDYSLGDLILASKTIKKRTDLSDSEKEVLQGLLPVSYGILSIINPVNRQGNEILKSKFTKAFLESNVELREFIENNLAQPNFADCVDEFDKTHKLDIFEFVKFSDLVNLIKDEQNGFLVRQARENIKYKKAIDTGGKIVFSSLKGKFCTRKYISIDDEILTNEFSCIESILMGQDLNPHSRLILSFLGVKDEEKQLSIFLCLCRNLSLGISSDYKEHFEFLCKISGLTTYKEWLNNFIQQETRIFIEDIDNFVKAKEVKFFSVSNNLVEGRIDIAEDAVQIALEEILSVPNHKNDWGGEGNDLFTANLKINGRRFATAFLLKGKGERTKTLEISHCGKNGDQIVRLFESPAELFIIQYVGNISENLIKDVQGKINEKRLSGKLAWYCIIDGQETARLLSAYNKLDK